MPVSHRPMLYRAAASIAALSLLALSGCVAYPYGYGGYGYGYAPAPAYYAPDPGYAAPPQRVWIQPHWENGYWVQGHWG